MCRLMDVELQQRAVEYLSLEQKPELARINVTAMPPWEKRKSLLLRRMAEREVSCLPLVGRFWASLTGIGRAGPRAINSL